MLRLEKVKGKNVWDLLILKVSGKGKGYGREALRLALEYIKTLPCGKAEYCWLGTVCK